ncbi:MAG: hypothetical protein OEY62_06610, partial [Acidimicrobiia bacterium]|nr:hypothetical protein [Acidimicrobiia bacterium]
MPGYPRRVELTLETDRPAVITRPDGGQHVEMAGFGVDSVPGAPRLPTLACGVELPLGAAEVRVEVVDDEWMPISGHFRISPAGAAVHDEPGDEATRTKAVDAAKLTAKRTQREIYRSDRWHPPGPACLEIVESTSTSVVAGVRVAPVRYNPERGNLQWTPAVRI